MTLMDHCRRVRAVLLALTLLSTAACASACDNSGKADDGTASSVSGNITVFAASSLTDAFKQLAADFTKANPGARVEFNFAGSPTLVTQLDNGASADVLATADQPNMDAAATKGLISGSGTPFARNRLVIIVPKDNPAHIGSPKDLANSGVKLVLADQAVPAGNYARQSLAKFDADAAYPRGFSAQALANVVSNEANVKAIVSKVQLGEADAGIVYVTDVTKDIQGDINRIAIPDQFNVIATYPFAVTKAARKPALAQAFIGYVLSDAGQATLESYGFLSAR
jgi:molybdate transport system substrate-binding protein